MSAQIDRRPTFTLVMGCNGAGKSAWKRMNFDRLPDRYFDQDSIAAGIGGWDNEDARKRTQRYLYTEINVSFNERLDFGIETTFSGIPGPQWLHRAKAEGYRVEGLYIGTESPDINKARVHHRVVTANGHYVDPDRIPTRHAFSLSNLRKNFYQFDRLKVTDNSDHQEDYLPQLCKQFTAECGEIVEQLADAKLQSWSRTFSHANSRGGGTNSDAGKTEESEERC